MAQTCRQYLNSVPEEQKLSLHTVLSPAFVRETTRFDSVDAFLDASPWAWRTPAQFRALTNDGRFDQYVARNSTFATWRAMEDAATLQWLDRSEQYPTLAAAFTDAFVWQKTGYASVDEFFAAGDWNVIGSLDVAAIPDTALDRHVTRESDLETWQDMEDEAVLRWVDRQLLC